MRKSQIILISCVIFLRAWSASNYTPSIISNMICFPFEQGIEIQAKLKQNKELNGIVIKQKKRINLLELQVSDLSQVGSNTTEIKNIDIKVDKNKRRRNIRIGLAVGIPITIFTFIGGFAAGWRLRRELSN